MRNQLTIAGNVGRMRLRIMSGRFGALDLTTQFLMATSSALLAGMIGLGSWVSFEIEAGVVHNTAIATALYLDNFIEPHVRELATARSISAEHNEALDRLLQPNLLGNRLVSFNVWDTSGGIVYSTRTADALQISLDKRAFARAIAGHVDGAYKSSGYDNVALKTAAARPLLEIYAPIRSGPSGRIIAIAEFYENAEALQEQLNNAKFESWLVVIIVTLGMLAVQYGIVGRGSRTIERQHAMLHRRVSELSRLLTQNHDLRLRVNRARRASHELNEQFMRRIGAELHDGPAQLVGLSILMLETSAPDQTRADLAGPVLRTDEIRLARDTLIDALEEIRQILTGLILPNLETLSLAECLMMAARAHTRRTQTFVETKLSDLPEQVSLLQKVSLYRIAQEGLNNAFHHADGKGQALFARQRDGAIELEVRDAGAGPAKAKGNISSGLGLIGLKDRVESLGGELEFSTAAEVGGRLFARIPLIIEEKADA